MLYDSTWEPRSDLMKKAAKAVLKYEKENDISKEKPERRKPKKRRQFDEDVDATRGGRWHVMSQT